MVHVYAVQCNLADWHSSLAATVANADFEDKAIAHTVSVL